MKNGTEGRGGGTQTGHTDWSPLTGPPGLGLTSVRLDLDGGPRGLERRGGSQNQTAVLGGVSPRHLQVVRTWTFDRVSTTSLLP